MIKVGDVIGWAVEEEEELENFSPPNSAENNDSKKNKTQSKNQPEADDKKT